MPWLSVDQMRDVDRVMVEDLGILLMQMMENAGRNLAVAARALLGGSVRGKRIVVLAGPGGNGGGGLVAARHLAVAGAEVRAALATPPERLADVPAHQAAALESMGVPLASDGRADAEGDLVVDALLGYSQSGAPRGRAGDLLATAREGPVLSLDTPSGLELGRAVVHPGTPHALATVTLAAPKKALRSTEARAHVGRLLVADISVPPAVYVTVGADRAPDFSAGPLIEVTP